MKPENYSKMLIFLKSEWVQGHNLYFKIHDIGSCVCIYITAGCLWMCVYFQVCVKVRCWHWVSSLVICHLMFMRHCLTLYLDLTDSARSACQWVPLIHLSLSHQKWGWLCITMTISYVDTGDPCLGPLHGEYLLTDPSPQLLIQEILK